MHEGTCARASAAARTASVKPFLTISGINQTPGFDAFLSRAARNANTAPMVAAELGQLAETHRFQRDLWDLLNTARRAAGITR